MSSRIDNRIRHIQAVVAIVMLIIALAATRASAASYTVRSGDTLYLIGMRYAVSPSAIRSASGLASDVIYPGQILTIPDRTTSQPSTGSNNTYTVRSGDTLFLLARRFGTTSSAIRSANSLWSDTIYPGQVVLIPSGSSNGGTTTPTPTSGLDSSDAYLLAKLVTAEAGGEPYRGQIAVAASVLNRVKSPKYPNSVSSVIYQVIDGRYYQYSPVLDGRINTSPTASALQAVREAMAGFDPSYGALGFYNPAKTSNYWVASRPVTTVIGQHVFFK